MTRDGGTRHERVVMAPRGPPGPIAPALANPGASPAVRRPVRRRVPPDAARPRPGPRRMRALHRMLLRDVWHHRGQLAAIAAVVACGIALFVALRSMNGFLRGSRDAFYADYRFAHLFVPLKRAPLAVASAVAALPGVQAVEPRIVVDVTLDVAGLAEPATGRLVSVPVPRRPALNDLHLRSGRWPEPGRVAEVVASAAFAAANDLRPGDSIGAVLNGRWQWLRLVGTAVSPEYVYEVSGGAIFPDARRFGVLWMGRDALAGAFGMRGAFNDLAVLLAPGASEPAVTDAVDRILAPHGAAGAYGRRVQLSAQFVDGEIEETQVTSVLLPAIFLGVTAFLLHVVLSRLVALQREQVATLKAFGYRSAAVGVHYLQLALVPVVAGSALGAGVGLGLAGALADIYARFFQFPSADYAPDWGVVAAAIAIGVAAGVAGALDAVARCTALPPAEALRAEAPGRYRRGLIERVPGIRRASPATRVVVRNLERRPGKAVLSVLGLAMAMGLVVAARALFDAIDFMQEVQFDHVAREDVRVTFEGPRPAAATRELARLPGVLHVEPFRAVPARLRVAHRSRHVGILGLARDGRLHRVVGADRQEHPLPEHGLLLSATLADILAVGPGDSVTIDVLEGARPRRPVVVQAIANELFGSGAYMEADALNRLVGAGSVVSGAFVRVDPEAAGALHARLKRLPAVRAVGVRAAERAGFQRTIADSFSTALYVTVGFACVIALGMAYNGARVALSERGRELASLRVLGFSRREVTAMLLGEQALLTVVAILPGAGIAWALSWLISVRFDSELFRIPVVVSAGSYVFGSAVVLAAAGLSALAVRGRVARLDLVAVLKARE